MKEPQHYNLVLRHEITPVFILTRVAPGACRLRGTPISGSLDLALFLAASLLTRRLLVCKAGADLRRRATIT